MRRSYAADLSLQILANVIGAVIGLAILKLAIQYSDKTQYTIFSSIFYVLNLVVLVLFSSNNVLSAKLARVEKRRQSDWETLFSAQLRCACSIAIPIIILGAVSVEKMKAAEYIAVGIVIFIAQILGEVAAFSSAMAVSSDRTSAAAAISLTCNISRLVVSSATIFFFGVLGIALGNLSASISRYLLNKKYIGFTKFNVRWLFKKLELREITAVVRSIRSGLLGLYVRQNSMFYMPLWLWLGARIPTFVESDSYILVPILGIISVIAQSLTTYIEGKLLSGKLFRLRKLILFTALIGLIGMVASCLYLGDIAEAFLNIKMANKNTVLISMSAGLLFLSELLSWVWLQSYQAGTLARFGKTLFMYQALVFVTALCASGDIFPELLVAFSLGRFFVALYCKISDEIFYQPI